jgi:spore protease
MKHEIDMSKYKIRTDLAIELINDKNQIKTKEFDEIKVRKININDKMSKEISKKTGRYITIEFEDVTDKTNKEKVKKILSQEFRELLDELKIKKNASCLIIGLGNEKSTPDSLGPKTINNLTITNHLYELGLLEKNYRRVSALNPGVMGETGIETSTIIESVANQTKPDFIIVVDALASSSIERVNKTIQITDAGINPGSGIGNNRKEISKEILKIPVIAVGVPTTVDAVTIVSDTLNYLKKNYSYTKKNIDNPMNKLIVKGNINYLKKDIKINQEEKEEILGLIGTLNDEETRQLIKEVLTPIGYNFMVTPKEIDFIITKLSEVIGDGLNQALHEI